MASAVDICNMALANLGDVADITSLDPPEGSAQAERCAQFYPLAVKTLLEIHDWGFATIRKPLVKYETNSRDNWRFCYAIPADCIKIIDLNDQPFPQFPPEFAKRHYDYEIGLNDSGQRCIYTNLEDAVMRYIANVGEHLFPANFVMALSWKLSGMLAGPLLKGDTGAQMTMNCEKIYSYWINSAMSIDANQHREYRESVPSWITGR